MIRSPTIVLLSILLSAIPFASLHSHALADTRAKHFDSGLSTPQLEDKLALPEVYLSSATATATPGGVLLQWRTSFEQDNLGFNAYRLRNGQRTRVNQTIIPGSVFIVGQEPLLVGRSYEWLDREGTADSVYYIESESSNGKRRSYNAAIAVSRGRLTENYELAESSNTETSRSEASAATQWLKEYPASLAGQQSQSPEGQIETQWSVAAQSALKIQVNHDGWYRVTQQQASGAGFNPTVDVRNLSLFGDGQEIAILTSKDAGQFVSGDYFEFYGRGLDTPTADTRVYYLIAGTQPGKRVTGELKAESSAIQPATVPVVESEPDLRYRGWFAPLVNFMNGAASASSSEENAKPAAKPSTSDNFDNNAVVSRPAEVSTAAPGSATPVLRDRKIRNAEPGEVKHAAPVASSTTRRGSNSRHRTKQTARSRRRNSRKRVKSLQRHYAHSLDQATAPPLSYNYTVQLKERFVYFTRVLNGEAENWFGRVISSLPAIGTIPVHNVMSSADGPASLVVALQGVQSSNPSHQVNVFFNDVLIGTVSFFGLDHPEQTFSIPVAQLLEGNNTVKLTQGGSNDVSIVDYLTLTYPHSYAAFSDSLRFSLRATQTLQVAGFSTPGVRLLDISDPTTVKVTRPIVGTNGSGYAITVPSGPRTKAARTMYALPEGQFETPAGFSLNQPSTLNAISNAADLLMISYKDFMPGLAPLVTRRQNEGLTVKVVDIEDVYDEFSYGAHDPQAIKDFLLRATNTWMTTKPRYVLLVGDASYDPRNYDALPEGTADFVPTKLVDTLFGEACSDDVLADFDGDGIADIAVGRLPGRTPAENNLMISKIVNFQKANVPQSALLVADNAAETNYYFDFDMASDQIGSLVSGNLTVQKVYRSTQPTCTARANVISAINQGVALVNYSGHGNVNVWAGSCTDSSGTNPFFQDPDARGLTNGNKLPLVVVSNCLNGYFNDPRLEALAESFLKATGGGAVATFASSGETFPDGQQQMSVKLYQLIFGGQSMALGDVERQAKTATTDMDVRHTWILLGDPSMKIW